MPGVHDAPDLRCFVPHPISFTASYNTTIGITLKWSNQPRPGHCNGSVDYKVQVAVYDSYSDFALKAPVSRVIDFTSVPPGDTSFTLPSDAALEINSKYYLFNVRQSYERTKGFTVHQTTDSPLYYFGRQGIVV